MLRLFRDDQGPDKALPLPDLLRLTFTLQVIKEQVETLEDHSAYMNYLLAWLYPSHDEARLK